MNRTVLLSVIAITILIVAGCKQSKYAATNKIYKEQAKAFAKVLEAYPLHDSAGLSYASDWVGTTNFTMRRPNYVIIHHTAQNSCEQTLKTFTVKGQREVSAHYVICKDGTVHHMLNDLLRAHHAGVSKWGNATDINSASVGIELDNNGFETFTEAQLNSLILLLQRLKNAYNIPAANFIGHGDIAPTRKNDPNWRFPWKQFSEKGFGLWWSDTTAVQVPAHFDYLSALRIVGYDIRDTSAAIQSFKRHFLQDTTKRMTPAADKILFSLYKKYQ
ncbi:MAG: N-acetylmuramoyl-L-alanine amidase AmiD precursor [Bacteroidetes bacterium ADurb.BinA245]|jgi:N-acetylmuramoyl-L-alanine amidase|nr:MAG: N-acetylmuramoyl-L-alanine amidase AmiD precursor [Bacteroidetes bacterium ADurb.BinA245]